MSPSMFSWHAAASGKTDASRSSDCMRWIVQRHASCRRGSGSSASDRLGVPAPARAEHRRRQHRLLEHLLHRLPCCRNRKTSPSGKLCCSASAMLMPSSVAAACSSKLNDRQKRLRSARPQAVDAAAERRVHDELHAAALVEEPLGDDAWSASAPRRARCGRRRCSRRPARRRSESRPHCSCSHATAAARRGRAAPASSGLRVRRELG